MDIAAVEAALPEGGEYLGSGQAGPEWRAQAKIPTAEGSRYITAYGNTEAEALADLVWRLESITAEQA